MSFSPVAPFSLTTFSASTSSTAAADYRAAIENNFVVAQRFGPSFAVSEQSPPSARNMTVHVSAGWLFDGQTLTEVAAQDTGAFTAPLAAPRIDRIVARSSDGVVVILTGTEAAAPVAPSLSTSYIPLAQLTLLTDTTIIGNSMLRDERAVWGVGSLPWDYQEFTSSGSTTWNKPSAISTNALVIAMVWGAGGPGTGASGGGTQGGCGGGGGACSIGYYRASDLSSAVTVVVPGASTIGTAAGGNGQFGSQLAYGGGRGDRGSLNGGGGGGLFSAGANTGVGGNPLGGIIGTNSIFGGGGGQNSALGGNSVYGGGAGASGQAGSTLTWTSTQNQGGRSMYGGGGGSGEMFSTLSNWFSGTPGASVFGGQGGKSTVAASAPGGGGGGSSDGTGTSLQNGARGEVRVWTLRG